MPSSTTPDLVYVCDGLRGAGEIWRSTDGAATFEGSFGSPILCLDLVEGNEAGSLWAAVEYNGFEAQVWRSTNSGDTWQETGYSTPGEFLQAILQLPSGRVLAGTIDAGGGGPPQGID